jgi:tyrosine-protein phosphatase YwqE
MRNSKNDKHQKQKSTTSLPDNLIKGVDQLSGMDIDNVKIHTNSSKPAQLNAQAFAQGSDIHFAPGQETHLPNEAWHVVQQKQGRVQPTLQKNSNTMINDEERLEQEADVMGDKAANHQNG